MKPKARSRLADAWHGSFVYGLLIGGRAPARLARLAPPPLPGSPERGAAIVGGRLVCGGRALKPERPDWTAPDLSAAAALELNAFEWLDDLAALGSELAQARARALVEDWILAHRGWTKGAWDPEPTGRRLAAWLAHAPFLSRGEGDPLGPMLLDSAARQARHLARVALDAPVGLARLAALKGLIYAHGCGLLAAGRLPELAAALAREAARDVLDDGFHAARGPSAQLRALACLVDSRIALEAAQARTPETLHRAIEKLAPATRFFRHGDGGFALFNDSTEEEPTAIDAVLARAQWPDPPLPRAAAAGFDRLAAERVVLIVDTGAPASGAYAAGAHAGMLAFEMSVGKERVIVNCGAGPRDDSDWSLALRATAAHSTLCAEDADSATVAPGGLLTRPATVTATREEADGNIWLDASHDGYAGRLGFVHRRRLFLAGDGQDLRGEDSLLPAEGKTPAPAQTRFDIRFHLHPDIQVSVIQNGAAALLRTASGQAWRLQVAGARLDMTESVYFGRKGSARRGEQIVARAISGPAGATVKWALKRIAGSK
ncbi:MAG: heparinase II/III family protein [Azospirillum sp.]|nr:heparinase II/III family protein [Azospirillum sp.]